MRRSNVGSMIAGLAAAMSSHSALATAGEGGEAQVKGEKAFDYIPAFGSYSEFRNTFRDDAARMAAAERRRHRKPFDPRPAPPNMLAGHRVRIYYSDGKPGSTFKMRDGRMYQYEAQETSRAGAEPRTRIVRLS